MRSPLFLLLVSFPCSLYAGCHILGWLYPTAFWGTDQLAYYPDWVGALFLFVASGAISCSAFPKLYDWFRNLQLHPLNLARPSAVVKAIFLLLFLLGAYTFRDQGHLLGDSDMWLKNLEFASTEQGRRQINWIRGIPLKGWEFIPAFEALDYLIHLKVYEIGREFVGFEPRDAYETVSCVCGLLYVIGLWKISGKLQHQSENRIPLFLFLVTLGSLQLFFGYGESYTVVTMVSCWYVLAALRGMQGGSLIVPTFMLVLSIGLHVMALSLVPSYVVMLWLRYGLPKAEFLAARSFRLIGIPLLVVGAWLMYAYFYPHNLPLFEDENTGTYGLLSPEHILIAMNALILISPFGLLWGGYFVLSRQRTDSTDVFFRWATIGPLALMFLHNAFLGARDWDLMSFPGFFYSLWGVYCLSRIDGVDIQRMAVAVVPLMVMHTALWVAINSNTDRALERLENIIAISNTEPHYRAFTQGHFYQNVKNAEPLRAAQFFREAAELAPSLETATRYSKFLGGALVMAGLYEDAMAVFEEAFKRQSKLVEFNYDMAFHQDWAQAGLQVGKTYQNYGERAKALQVWNATAKRLSEVLKLIPTSGLYLHLGLIQHAAERFEDAAESYWKCLELEEDRNLQHATYMLLASTLQETGNKEGVKATLERARNLKPKDPEVHFFLANANLSEGNHREAIDLYRTAIRLDASRVKFHLMLGIALEENGFLVECRDVYARASRMRPGDAAIEKRLDQVNQRLYKLGQ